MKVLYFHQHFTTPDGSGGTRSYEFARALLARGHQVTMVCGLSAQAGLHLTWDAKRGWHRGMVEGIDVISLPLAYSNRYGIARRAWIFLRFAWRSIMVVLRIDFDMLFATSTPLTVALPGIAIKLAGRRKAFVFEVRDLWPELPRALGMKNPFLLGSMSALEWMAYRCADACIGLSPGIVEGIRRRAPKGHWIEMIPNACDLELFRPGKRSDLNLLGVEPKDFVAVFCGAHGVANGLDAALDAAGVLCRRGRSDIKLVFIGDGKLKPALMARAQREQLGNCLFFEPMPKRRLAEVLGAADAGLMLLADVPAFYHGTSPNKFFDYIAAGLPVLNNYPGWLAGLIDEFGCGRAIPPSQPEVFADALEQLADNPARRCEMGRQARQLAEQRFDRLRLAAEFGNLIESVRDRCPAKAAGRLTADDSC